MKRACIPGLLAAVAALFFVSSCTWEVTYFTDKPGKKDVYLKITEVPKQ